MTSPGLRAGTLCANCGHEYGEHTGACEKGIGSDRPCGCRDFVAAVSGTDAESRVLADLTENYLRPALIAQGVDPTEAQSVRLSLARADV